jgi:hypothetical protein
MAIVANNELSILLEVEGDRRRFQGLSPIARGIFLSLEPLFVQTGREGGSIFPSTWFLLSASGLRLLKEPVKSV